MGLLGLLAIRSSSGRVYFLDSRERWAYVVFFGGVLATAFGSAWYHLDPGDARLGWDRLAIAIAFMGFLAAMIGERISPRTGLRFLVPLVLIGAGSVFYLQWTESLGRGDLRGYLFVQFFPIVLVPLLVLLFPARYTRSADLLGAVGLYVAAKICEALDAQIFSLGHLVSGHTLKHLFAAAAPLCILLMLRWRNRL